MPATGRIVEIGSFRGRSMIAIARSAPEGAEIVAIDPHAGNDRGPQEIEGFEDEAAVDSKVFLTNLERAGVRDRVTYVRKFSHDALDDVPGPIDLLHIDGAHRYKPASDDIATLGRPGGRRRVDAGARLVLVGRRHAGPGVEARRSRGGGATPGAAGRWPSTVREPVTGTARVANVGRQLAQLPWFARNVVIKVLIVAKLPKATRLLGHAGENWPY